MTRTIKGNFWCCGYIEHPGEVLSCASSTPFIILMGLASVMRRYIRKYKESKP